MEFIKLALFFISGFLYNFASLVFECIPMSMKAGIVCIKLKSPIWDIDELDFLEEIGNFEDEN